MTTLRRLFSHSCFVPHQNDEADWRRWIMDLLICPVRRTVRRSFVDVYAATVAWQIALSKFEQKASEVIVCFHVEYCMPFFLVTKPCSINWKVSPYVVSKGQQDITRTMYASITATRWSSATDATLLLPAAPCLFNNNQERQEKILRKQDLQVQPQEWVYVCDNKSCNYSEHGSCWATSSGWGESIPKRKPINRSGASYDSRLPSCFVLLNLYPLRSGRHAFVIAVCLLLVYIIPFLHTSFTERLPSVSIPRKVKLKLDKQPYLLSPCSQILGQKLHFVLY